MHMAKLCQACLATQEADGGVATASDLIEVLIKPDEPTSASSLPYPKGAVPDRPTLPTCSGDLNERRLSLTGKHGADFPERPQKVTKADRLC